MKILEKLIEILRDSLQITKEIDENSKICEDLEMDNVDILDLINHIEDEFYIQINDEEIFSEYEKECETLKLRTIIDWVNFIEKEIEK